MRRLYIAGFTLVLGLIPLVVEACPVCAKPADGTDGTGTRWAFYLTTLGLMLIPAGMITGMVCYLRKNMSSTDPSDPFEDSV
jgi:hypothetical protein